MNSVWGKVNFLLLGVTGGIASGKTTVANMLKELGAPIIDFDILARQVVEPGKSAWKKIVDYFGKNILEENGDLDRKKLSKIVFHDTEKRKKLESFTHPLIFEEFARQVNEMAGKCPGTIIQAAIPLLMEFHLQVLFHKVLLVYIPRERQIERLIKRDGITKKEAASMLRAQLPIDEKMKSADFVINNEGSIEETRKQVEDVWQILKKFQKELGEHR
jgi:dephospho-CoA kinase